jgi:hypothetical protein
MSEDYVKQLEQNSQMLGRIAGFVGEFAKNEEDTTILCVLRLLQDYHYTKANSLQEYIDAETELSEPIK